MMWSFLSKTGICANSPGLIPLAPVAQIDACEVDVEGKIRPHPASTLKGEEDAPPF